MNFRDRKVLSLNSSPTNSNSKLYSPNWLSLTSDTPNAHTLILDTRPKQKKQVVEMRQIDKILHGVIKERMFGTIEQLDGYHIKAQMQQQMHRDHGKRYFQHRSIRSDSPSTSETIKEMRKESIQTRERTVTSAVGRQKTTNSTFRITQPRGTPVCSSMLRFRKIFRSFPQSGLDDKNTPTAEANQQQASKHISFDQDDLDQLPTHTVQSQSQSQSPQPPLLRKETMLTESMQKTAKPANQPFRRPPIILSFKDVASFPDYFREASKISVPNSPTPTTSSLLNDTRVTKQQLRILFKVMKMPLSDSVFDRFYSFFDLPQNMHYRQYMQLIENIVNLTTPKEIQFLCFQFMDRNRDGLITVEDLFQFLEENSGVSSLQQDIFIMHDRIVQSSANTNGSMSKSLQVSTSNKEVQTDEFLVRNHNLKLELYRQLLKNPSKEIVSCNAKKSTVYHLSIQALEHYEHVRLKKDQLEDTKSAANSQLKSVKNGLRLRDFEAIYNDQRPRIFIYIVEVLVSRKPDTLV